ncbi:MAG: hypothetical protein JOZ24_04140 [Candidatus Eremiobacteraeota bacterium]|nr:hypothetical protein [Candidatus Eremiobacteraeota bacterium]
MLERLAAATQYRVATILAPAGFGKSVAVRQFISTVPASVVYDVPSDATTLVAFVRGFADALAGVVPALQRSLGSALDGARGSANPGRELAAWAAAHCRELDMLIVIDDLHNAEPDPEVSKFIGALVERTKAGPRWLFSSRTPLELPIATWLAYAESDLPIDAVDLRFSFEEAKQSARATRVAVRDDELSQILELIDGWPAALTFALRTSTRASDLRTVAAGTREMVYRYLAEQVWHGLEPRFRDFLRTAAFLPRLETRLAVAAGYDDAAAIIEQLRERVAFITAIEPGVYALHDLFRDFVLRQVQLDGDAALRDARTKAGALLERAGLYREALERYIDARATTELQRLLAKHNFALLEHGCYDIVERALPALPATMLTKNPRVLALRAALEDAHGRVDQAERWYAAVLAAGTEDLPFRVTVASRYALMLYQQGRLDAVPILEQLRARDDLSSPERATVVGMLAMTYGLAGRHEEARELIAEAIDLAQLGDDELRARTFNRASTIAFYAQDEQAAEAYTREATRLALDQQAFALAARFLTTLTAIHAFAGRVAAAAWYAAQVAANAEKAGDPQTRAGGLRSLLQLEAERGNGDRVSEVERQLMGLAYRGHVAELSYAIGRVLLLGWDGRFGDARELLAAVPDARLAGYQRAYKYALLAVLLARAGLRDEAAVALKSYATSVAHSDDRAIFRYSLAVAERYAVLANILLERHAWALRALRAPQYESDAVEDLTAFLFARLNRSPDREAEALKALRLRGLAGVARFLDAIAPAPEPAQSLGVVSVLTGTERLVLVAMAQGLSNKAIADEQGRTINTVRTHVSSILRKLGCESRGEAVAAALRRRLI